MKISKVTDRKEKEAPGRTARHVTGWIFAVCIFAGTLVPAFSLEITPRFNPSGISSKGTVSELGACKIKVLQAYFWRDWMPIVGRPGPDRGSPLRAKATLILDNSTGSMSRVSFRAVIVDEKGQRYPVPFRALPIDRLLPDAALKSSLNFDDEAKSPSAAGHNAAWSGELKPGEIREVQLATSEGPYLSVGSSIYVEIFWSDQTGNSAVVRTPASPIQRTD